MKGENWEGLQQQGERVEKEWEEPSKSECVCNFSISSVITNYIILISSFYRFLSKFRNFSYFHFGFIFVVERCHSMDSLQWPYYAITIGMPDDFVAFINSNYQQIQSLAHNQHEIATETISLQQGLQDKGYEEWVGEMIGMREILRHFSNVSTSDVVGMRAPYLKPGRNTQYKVSLDLMIKLANERLNWMCWTCVCVCGYEEDMKMSACNNEIMTMTKIRTKANPALSWWMRKKHQCIGENETINTKGHMKCLMNAEDCPFAEYRRKKSKKKSIRKLHWLWMGFFQASHHTLNEVKHWFT